MLCLTDYEKDIIFDEETSYEDKINQLAELYSYTEAMSEEEKREVYGPRPKTLSKKDLKRHAIGGAIGGALAGGAAGLGAGAIFKRKAKYSLVGAGLGAAAGALAGSGRVLAKNQMIKQKQKLYDEDPVRYRRQQFKEDDLKAENMNNFLHYDRNGNRRYGAANTKFEV